MHLRHVVLAGLVVASLVTITAPAAAATDPAFTVELRADGSADVAVTYAFDLDTDAEQAAFQELRDNQSVRESYATRFEDRLGAVAANAADRTGRDMRVSDVAVDVTTDGSTGVVTVSGTWHGLAAVAGDQLVVTEPFASGFEPDRRFVVTLPDGYGAEATPAPDERAEGRLVWHAGADLDGFDLTATADGGGTGGDGTSALGPGFGVAAAVGGTLTAGLLAGRCR